MQNPLMKKLKYVLLITFIILTISPVSAQQTIITVPSSDVLPLGEVILKQSNKFSPFSNGYTSLTPQFIIGTGKDTEMSVGAGTNITDNNTSVKLNIAAKKVFKIKKGVRFTMGGTISPSLTEGQNPDSMIYAHGSYICKKTKTTITAGGFVGGKGEMPSLTRAMIGIDQTIIPNKLRVALDYISGDESWGVLAAGLKIRPEPTTSITTAVIIPNDTENRVAFSISVSKYVGKIFEERSKNTDSKTKENI